MTIHAPLSLLSDLAQVGKGGNANDELIIHKNESGFSVIRTHCHPLYRLIQQIGSSVAEFFENILFFVRGNPAPIRGRTIQQQQRAETVGVLSDIFGSQRLHRAAAWCDINPSSQKNRCLFKHEISSILHALAQITTDDVNELLADIHSSEDSIRGLSGEGLAALRTRFANKHSVEECSFDEIRTLEGILLPFASPDLLFWEDPSPRFNDPFGSAASLVESVGWACHLLRTRNFLLKDWEALVAKRFSQPAIPPNLLIPHPNGAYIHFCSQVESGGASKRFFRTLHPDITDPLILYRGTRCPMPRLPLSDIALSWLEDVRRELGASGPIATYEETKRLLEEPSRGFVSNPKQQISLLAFSIGGPQAMRDAVLFSERIRRLTTNGSPGVDRQTADLFRKVMDSPRKSPMIITHNIDKGDIVDTAGDEHIGADCKNVSLSFRVLCPNDGSTLASQLTFINRRKDFFFFGPSLPPKIIGVIKAHMRATTADGYHDETISTDDQTTKKLAEDYAKHLAPCFDPSWEQARLFFCPAPSPDFASFARHQLNLL